jgi:hypothetical protein
VIQTLYRAIVYLAFTWTAINCVYVYLVLQGGRAYRIESAVWVLALLMLPLVVSGRRGERFPPLTPTQQRLILGAAVGLWLLTFLPLLDFPFLSDDYVFLGLYKRVRDVTVAPQFFRPLFALVFWALDRLGDGSPLPFHATSLLLHFASACLVYALARRLFESATPAIVCFSVFLLNPLQLEATLWPSGLQELLWTAFILAALRCYVGERELSLRRLVATMALVGCALLSKETAVSFILLLPAADVAFYRLNRGRVLPFAYVTFAATLVGYLWLRRHFVAMEADFLVTPSRFFLKQFLATPYKYFAQPWNAAAIDVPALIPCVLSLLILALLFILIVVQGSSARLLIGPALILMTTLPVYSYFYVGEDLVAARYIYCASVGWAFVLAQLLSAIRQRGLFVATVTGLVLISAVWLQLNLRPWRVAADVVHEMHAGLGRGEPLQVTIAQWQARHSTKLELKNGIPYEHQGVGIFINGYDEFSRMAQQPR